MRHKLFVIVAVIAFVASTAYAQDQPEQQPEKKGGIGGFFRAAGSKVARVKDIRITTKDGESKDTQYNAAEAQAAEGDKKQDKKAAERAETEFEANLPMARTHELVLRHLVSTMDVSKTKIDPSTSKDAGLIVLMEEKRDWISGIALGADRRISRTTIQLVDMGGTTLGRVSVKYESFKNLRGDPPLEQLTSTDRNAQRKLTSSIKALLASSQTQ
jgi:hypothetical protein